MKLTTTRIREMHKCGFSPEVIAKNLREQGHDVEAKYVRCVLGIKPPPPITPTPKKMVKYKVNTKSYTFRTTEEMKNNYHAICEMINNGLTNPEIAPKFGYSHQHISYIKTRNLTKIK